MGLRSYTRRAFVLAGFVALLGVQAFGQQISGTVVQQISDIESTKDSLNPAQQKLDSSLLFPLLSATGRLNGASFQSVIPVTAADTTVNVEIHGNITPQLITAIQAAGGTVIANAAQFGIVSASVPLNQLEGLATNSDIRNIQREAGYQQNAGSVTSQGYIAHAANVLVEAGINGAGVKVGVMSDSATPSRVAALIASGDLPANTTVLSGQSGGNQTDEGTAMMEIVHDIAPGAVLEFATALSTQAQFASNIVALANDGCNVIVDDFTYFAEGAFQDGPIAQAVNTVTGMGVTYVSSAANSGNLTSGTSGTWEGDFVDGGAVGAPIPGTGNLHNFGGQNFDVLNANSGVVSLKWSDPLGASANDYDLFILNSTGTAIVAFSATVQNGTQDPLEILGSGGTAGLQVVIVKRTGAAVRAIRIDTNRGQLSIGTAGSTFGHNAGLNTVTTAASYWNSARSGTKPFTGPQNPIEVFSSDGPRKVFYQPNGTPITPGNFLFGTNGGTTLIKPDVTAADGNNSRTPGFTPFFGTSAAAPHAAGIAALILQARPGYTPAQVKTAIQDGTVDNMVPGVDRDSGFGIVMATLAVAFAQAH